MFFDLKVQSDKSVTDDAKIGIFRISSKLFPTFFYFNDKNNTEGTSVYSCQGTWYVTQLGLHSYGFLHLFLQCFLDVGIDGYTSL